MFVFKYSYKKEMSLFFETFKIFIVAALTTFFITRSLKLPLFPSQDRDFHQKIVHSIIHILIMCALPDLLIYANIIQFSNLKEHIPSKIALYIISFDAVYALVHFSQHKWFEWSHKEHHDMKDMLYPGYAFVYSPIDSLLVQLCIYSPFYFGLHFTLQTWYLAVFVILLYGFMGHTERGWIDIHRKHHRKPHEGRYSFTGMPEHILSALK